MKKYPYIFIMLAALFLGGTSLMGQTTVSYSYTGGQQTWCVPPGVTSVTVDMAGAGGGKVYNGGALYGTPGNGGRITATLAVTPGQTIYIYVAGKGGNGASSSVGGTGGYNGGGHGYGDGSTFASGGGGGGASDVRIGGTALPNRVLVAGGGGGVGVDVWAYNNGGNAGQAGTNGSYGPYEGAGEAGKKGTSTSGGAATTYTDPYCSITGTASGAGGNATGGNGSSGSDDDGSYCYYTSGGGGGGGYYAGSGGSGGGGGGGYCYTAGSGVSSSSVTAGYESSNGYVKITYTQFDPSPITGTSSQCSGATGQVYSITAVSGATNYVWSVPSGWSITSGSGTNSITVTVGAAGQNGAVSVYAQNACSVPTKTATLSVTSVNCCTTPGAPTSVVGTSSGQTTASLSWAGGSPAGSATVTYYWVVGTSSSVTYGSGADQGVASGLSASTSALSCGTTYYLRVYAKTSCDGSTSAYTTSASFTTTACCSATSDAGPNQYICSGATSTTMAAGSSPGTWIQLSGPATVTITSPSSATTTVTGLSVSGTYAFRWSCGSAYDDMIIVKQ